MEEFYNKHYVTVDGRGRIVEGWSDGPKPHKATDAALCINQRGGYQFRLADGGEENPPLFTREGIPLYKLEGSLVAARTEEEVRADQAAIPSPGPTHAERLEAQVTYTAMMTDTLLEEG